MTRRKSSKKRTNQRRPGLIAAAKELGCSYGHLRLCVAGQRVSVSLMTRYEALKAEQNRKAAPAQMKPGLATIKRDIEFLQKSV
ncbi:MAG: hypothetical protein U1F65_05155 [Verrucomicrobiota bacterium]